MTPHLAHFTWLAGTPRLAHFTLLAGTTQLAHFTLLAGTTQLANIILLAGIPQLAHFTCLLLLVAGLYDSKTLPNSWQHWQMPSNIGRWLATLAAVNISSW